MGYASKFSDRIDDKSWKDGELIDLGLELLQDADDEIKELKEKMSSLMIESIANYIVITGIDCTSSGNYIFYCDELSEHFRCSTLFIKEHIEEIENEIRKHSAVTDDGDGVWIYEENNDTVIDVNFFTDYCGLSSED